METVYLEANQTISQAIKNAPENAQIMLEGKVYREKIIVDKRGITLRGVNGKTKIVYGDYAKKIHADGMEYNTFRTYTVNVVAPDVTFCDLCIENDSYEPKTKGQAVALSVYGDNFRAENVTLKSAQDTLFSGPLPDDLIFRYDGFLPDGERYFEGEARSYFKDCTVYGSVDYVFGCGTAYFSHCKLVNINDGRSVQYVCAPAHSLKQKRGFTFYKCEFTSEEGLKAFVYLARPWRDYGKCSFISCKLNNRVIGELFDRWNDTVRYLTARFEVFDTPHEKMVTWGKTLTQGEAENLVSEVEKFC